ncbi:hypothetical protein D7241_17760 [Stutzerimonas sp. VN223-3]|uniref:hypothetical protein n=1 Tax=Stutzerimonas TaxID=2901164 RepID=UPI002109C7A2|nr:hypothetical protein [Stutzerimonas stutzeri]MCQ4312035.1 hypothetical protein [Stutzerimonas stutzeri]
MSRSNFHQQHAERAAAEARRLLEKRSALGARWLAWVASELYQLTPPEYAAMVRRELARLNEG